MKTVAIAALLGAVSAIRVSDADPYFNEGTWNERYQSAAGLVQLNSCMNSKVAGVSCVPNAELTMFVDDPMRGDEDLGQDITMKGKPFHYMQGLPACNGENGVAGKDCADLQMGVKNLAQWTPVNVKTPPGSLPPCHGTNGPDGVNCVRQTCDGTNGPKDGESGTPCTTEEPAAIPAYSTDPTAGSPYATTGNLTPTYPGANTELQMRGDNEPEKVSVLDPKIARTHTTFYNKI